MPRLHRIYKLFESHCKPRLANRSKSQRRSQRCYEALESRQLLAVVPLAPLAGDDAFSTTEDQILVGNVIAGSPQAGQILRRTPACP